MLASGNSTIVISIAQCKSIPEYIYICARKCIIVVEIFYFSQ